MGAPLKIPYAGINTNPGFQIGDLLIWDESVVPKERQPRTVMGRVTGLWHNGCSVLSEAFDEPIYHSFELLCLKCLVERD